MLACSSERIDDLREVVPHRAGRVRELRPLLQFVLVAPIACTRRYASTLLRGIAQKPPANCSNGRLGFVHLAKRRLGQRNQGKN